MKITFDKLETSKSYVEVKADDYTSVYYDVDEASEDGVSLDSEIFSDLDDIQIGGNNIKPSFTINQKLKYIGLGTNLSVLTLSEFNERFKLDFKDDRTRHYFYITDFDWENDLLNPKYWMATYYVIIPKSVKFSINLSDLIILSKVSFCYEGTVSELQNLIGIIEDVEILCRDDTYFYMRPKEPID